MPGSLTLGGYDQSRTSKNLTVPTSGDVDRPLTVGLQKIVVTNSAKGTMTLMDTGILAAIDSSVPELWLPRSVCEQFETAFEIQYHQPSGRYALSDATRDRLRQLSPTITLTLGVGASEGSTINIDLPYSAFDLQAGYPIFSSDTNYFPIRRAANASQFVIGRAFLQEAYLSVDWERSYFNVSQAVFATPMPDPHIVTILSNNATFNSTGNGSSQGPVLSGGAIAGIAIGAVVAIIAIALGIFLLIRRRRAANRPEGTSAPPDMSQSTSPVPDPLAPELMGVMVEDPRLSKPPQSPGPPDEQQRPELMGTMIGELPAPTDKGQRAVKRESMASEVEGDGPRYELSGDLGYRC